MQKIIEVYKTNVANHRQAREIIKQLTNHLPGAKINIDLDDCDKVLRIETADFQIDHDVIMYVFQKLGNICEPMP